MTVHAPVAALRVANEAFLVSSTIERCPKTMMIRELVVNAIEAASTSPGDKLVEIMSRRIEGTPKLCIRNTGEGMSAAELDRICDLASSLHKINSLDANFGMGAKVASLPSNKHGLRYRSCKGGVASEVILCQRDGVYGRLRRGEDAAGEPLDVIDATAACRAEGGYDLGIDWTEVVLYGNSAEQNTVTDPYGGNPRSEPEWLTRELLLRFYQVPENVVVMLRSDVLGSGPAQRMRTLSEPGPATRQEETVRTSSGVALHYRFDPPGTVSESTKLGGVGCIVYKNEIYDPRTGARWVLDGPTYGLTFGAKHISVFVELPDDYLVRPEGYRQFLRFRGGDQRQVYLLDFAPLVAAYLPAWLKAIVRSFGPQQSRFDEEVSEELRSLLMDLEVAPEYVPPKPPEEAKQPEPEPEAKHPEEPRADDEKPLEPEEPKPAPEPPPKKYEQPPEIIGLEDEEMIRERGLKDRAAKFYPGSHQLFVNLQYTAVSAVAAGLELEFSGASDPERMRSAARSIAGWAVTRRIARALIYSLSKKAAGWPAEDVTRAQSPESFTLVADDWSSIMDIARVRMEDELGEASPNAVPQDKAA